MATPLDLSFSGITVLVVSAHAQRGRAPRTLPNRQLVVRLVAREPGCTLEDIARFLGFFVRGAVPDVDRAAALVGSLIAHRKIERRGSGYYRPAASCVKP